jgi:hypothetical protein
MLSYIENRFEDSNNIKENVYRIKFGIDVKPTCRFCGNVCKFIGGKKIYADTCCSKECVKKKIEETNLSKFGSKWFLGTKECHEKTKQTCLEKYGTEYYQSTNECKSKVIETNLARHGYEHFDNEKIKQYWMDHYGVENCLAVKEVRDKAKQTCLERYGTENYQSTKEWQEKIKETCQRKYGADTWQQSSVYKENYSTFIEKRRQTCLEKYGKESFCQTDEWREKVLPTKLKKEHDTKERHQSFTKSTIEEQFYKWLIEQGYEVKRQYSDERYTFNSDFYLPQFDLFIEIQGHWTHGGHDYDENSEEDRKKLEKWKSKSESKFYKQAVYIWTDLDPRKLEQAKKNEINLLRIYSIKLDECIKEFENYENKI